MEVRIIEVSDNGGSDNGGSDNRGLTVILSLCVCNITNSDNYNIHVLLHTHLDLRENQHLIQSLLPQLARTGYKKLPPPLPNKGY